MTQNPIQRTAAGLMLLSGITHPMQILVYGTAPEIAEPARAGSIFLLVGLGLLTRYRVALWVGIVLPLLGGSAAVLRIVAADPTAFTWFHAAIDFVVVGCCVGVLRGRGESPAA